MIKRGKIGKKSGDEKKLDISEQTERIVRDSLVKEQEPKREFNKFIYLLGIIGPLLAFFQAFKIFSMGLQSAPISYWLAYLIVAVMWLIYGVYYKNKAVIVGYGLWIVIQIIIIISAFLYT